jgi:hypothetical protein
MQDEVVTRQHFTSNCGSAYARIGDKARRLFNTAVFSRLAVRDGTIVECDFGRPWTSSSACLRSNTEVLWSGEDWFFKVTQDATRARERSVSDPY